MSDQRRARVFLLAGLLAVTCSGAVASDVLAAEPVASAPAAPDKPAPPPPDVLAKDLEPLMGTAWFGVYFNNKDKCGYAKMVLVRGTWHGQPVYMAEMVMDIAVTMGAATQKMAENERRFYRLTGELAGFESASESILGVTKMAGEIKGDKLIVTSTSGGRTGTRETAAPPETLEASLAALQVIRKGQIGGSVEFPVYNTHSGKVSRVGVKLMQFEDRVMAGVKTRVALVETFYHDLGARSIDVVTMDGDLLETVIGGMLTLKKEPEAVAKNARIAFDALRSGLMPVAKPLGDPRNISALTLKFTGVEEQAVLIDDDRQAYERGGNGKAAVHVLKLRCAEAPKEALPLPIRLGPDDKQIAQFLEAGPLVQSNDPLMIQTARQIIGQEKDSYRAACAIETWVFRNLRKEGVAAVSDALGVLKARKGDCSEHSVLFVALCRAAGIPARQAIGIGYSDELKAFGYHAWGEVYVGKWVAMDPTWGETLADATHVKFGIEGIEAAGALSGLYNQLKIEVVDFQRGK